MTASPVYRLVPAAPRARVDAWSPDQRAVLDAGSGPTLVLGGPGTGKTALLVELVARAVEAGHTLGRMLVVTHSRAAAQALRTDIVRRCGGGHVAPQVTTVHGFALSLVQRHSDEGLWGPPRLLRAPEQEFRLRELLQGHDLSGWPPEMAAASGTRLFATQVRAVLARARQLGLDPEDLSGFATSDPVWGAVGEFFDEYLTVLDFESSLDYAELVHRARLLLTDDAVRASVASEVQAVFCDEFAELDAAQLQVLGDLAGLGSRFVAVADPQQSIFRFRGADSGPGVWFADRFPDGATHVLTTDYRAGSAVSSALAAVASRITAVGAPPPMASAQPGGVVRAVVYDDTATEVAQLAERLRTAHLIDGVPWRDCAVITRTARAELTPVARSLRQFGIPVEVAGDEIALGEQLAVRPLVLALQVVLSGTIDPDQAARLLTSPLAGLDAVRLRALGKRLRNAEKAAGRIPAPSAELLAKVLMDPSGLPQDDDAVAGVRSLALLIQACRADVARGASVHAVLWRLWTGGGWPEKLWRAAVIDGELRAGGDLDAVSELFEVAAGSDLAGERGLRVFLNEVSAQVIPADTARESDPRGRGVRLLTAHRAKGEQFRRVFVIGCREGNWPKLTRRGSLLEPEMLTADGVLDVVDVSSQVADERRLFYVACSRASEQLVVTGTRGVEGEGERRSRFLDELGVEIEVISGRAQRPLTVQGLVADLRAVASDPQAEPALRRAAASRLATLGSVTDSRGRPVAPDADPDRWWGVAEPTGRAPQAGPLRFVGTDVADILECPRRWFLGRKVKADQARSSASSLGTVVHLLAQHALASELSPSELGDHLEAVWDQIPFEAAWLSASEKAAAEAALERLYAWQDGNDHRTVLGVEVGFEVDVDVAGEPVTLAGSVDRLELDGEGRLRVVDFKTARSLPTRDEVAGHEQLGVYQLAATAGAFDSLAPGVRSVAGAELVFLRAQDGTSPWPKVLTQPPLDDTGPDWVHNKLADAAAIARSGQYRAVRCASCRFCPFQQGCPVQATGREVVS